MIFPTGKIVKTPKSQGVHLHLYPEMDRKIARDTSGKDQSGHRYFRLVLYPSQFKGSDFDYLQQVLAHRIKPFSYHSLYHFGRVTRLDLAVDDLLHPAHSFLPFRRMCNVSGIYTTWFGQKGTIYLGSKFSPLQFANYIARLGRCLKLEVNRSFRLTLGSRHAIDISEYPRVKSPQR